MERYRILRPVLMVGIWLSLVLTSTPGAAQAQVSGGTGFRIDSWSVSPETLVRGGEFEITVKITNISEDDVTDIIVTIGSGQSFVGLTAGEYVTEIEDGQSKRVTLRGAVSNSITTGYYSLPIQISYRLASTGTAATDSHSVGVYVEGLTPAGQDEGQPAFQVTNWSVQPEELKRGEEFDLTVTIQNIGTWDGDEVVVEIGSGQSFVGLATSETIPRMQIGESRTVTVRGAVSNQIVTGHYPIPLVIHYHHSATGGQRLADNVSLGVPVQGIAPSLGADRGRPQLVIEDTSITPGPDSDTLLMTLTLRNVGNLWATRVIVNLGRSDIFAPAEGSTAFPVEGTIKLDETATVTLPLTLLRSPGERATQELTIEYASFSGAPYQSTQSVPVELGGVSQRTPRLLVEHYSTDPAAITPGATFRLTLDIANVGGGDAQRVFVRLGQDAAALGPLAPVGSSNVQYVERIAGGARVTLAYDLIADGEAEAGLVPLDLTLEYEDAFGVVRTETVTISVQVVEAPFLDIDFFEPLPEPILVGDVFELPIEVINIGQRQVNVSTVQVTSDKLRVTGGSLYIGPLDGGTSGTIIPEAEALQAGEVEVMVQVNYLDSFQRPQAMEKVLTVTVEAVSLDESGQTDNGNGIRRPVGNTRTGEEEEPTGGQRIWRGVLGFLGLGTTPPEEVQIGRAQPPRRGPRD